MATLSDKVAANVKAMGTGSWKMAHIEWTKEEREVWGKVVCPDCKGRKMLRYNDDGSIIPPPVKTASWTMEGWKAEQAYYNGLYNGGYGSCRRCKDRNMVSKGDVRAKVKKMVDIGRVVWPEECKFDSRYQLYDCGACGKNGITSATIPMIAQDYNGNWHGMWVGQDCARKFFEMRKADLKILDNDAQINR